MSASLQLSGFEEIKNALVDLERKIARRTLAQMGRASMKVIKAEMEKTIPLGPEKDGKHERDAVKVVAGKRSSVSMSYKAQISSKDIQPIRSKKTGQSYFYPAVVEWGSVSRNIPAGGQQRQAFENKKYEAVAVAEQTGLRAIENLKSAD